MTNRRRRSPYTPVPAAFKNYKVKSVVMDSNMAFEEVASHTLACAFQVLMHEAGSRSIVLVNYQQIVSFTMMSTDDVAL
eukprot:4434959-Amphidinium_carterae.2